MKNTPRITTLTKLTLVAAACAIVLSACGGGGGGTTTTAVTPTPAAPTPAATVAAPAAPATPTAPVTTAPTPTPLTANFVTSVPTPAYPTGSEELAAFNLLNAERTQCGFGKLAQNSQLDAASKAHADYQLRNNVRSHFESLTQFPLGFTGVNDFERIAFQGYADVGASTDLFNTFFGGDGSKTNTGAIGMRTLLSAPYHLTGLVDSYREIGVSVRNGVDVGSSIARVILQINPAYKASAGPQLMAASDVLTYPCEGSTGVNRQLLGESPNPVPGRNLAVEPLGTAILVTVREGQTVRITSSSVTKVSTGVPVVMRAAIDNSNDPAGPCTRGCFQPHQAYVIPDGPLDANSAYNVVVAGTNNGVGFTRSFRFFTGVN